MMWIHGGGFGGGSGNSESSITYVSGPGPGYILNRNVVLVTINYRLGVFGKCQHHFRMLFTRRIFHILFSSITYSR